MKRVVTGRLRDKATPYATLLYYTLLYSTLLYSRAKDVSVLYNPSGAPHTYSTSLCIFSYLYGRMEAVVSFRLSRRRRRVLAASQDP